MNSMPSDCRRNPRRQR